jgi:hypothetical protein
LIDVIVVVLMTLFGGNGLPSENHHPKSNNETLFDLRRQSLSLLDGTIRVIPRVITGYPTAVANLSFKSRDDLFSYLIDFSYFLLKIVFRQLVDTVRTDQKDHF